SQAAAESNDTLNIVETAPMRLDRKPPFAHARQHVAVAGSDGLAGGDQLIREGRQPAARDQRGIEVAHRACRRISGVGKERLTSPFSIAVHALECGSGQIDFAADFHSALWRAAQRERNRANGAHVSGNILPVYPVASRRAADQTSILVRERDAET